MKFSSLLGCYQSFWCRGKIRSRSVLCSEQIKSTGKSWRRIESSASFVTKKWETFCLL